MSDVKTTTMSTSKIYILGQDGSLTPRKWNGEYSSVIASTISPSEGIIYEHVGFNEKDGLPIVREINVFKAQTLKPK